MWRTKYWISMACPAFDWSPSLGCCHLANKIAIGALLSCGLLTPDHAKPSDAAGAINFFGYQGLDVAKVRAALPVQTGDQLNRQTKGLIEDAVQRVIGK